MQFDAYGNPMPYDLIPTDPATVRAMLVEAFPHSPTRADLFAAFLRYVERLRALVGGGFTIWLDGSFVTRKPDPADVDFVTLLDAARYTRHETALETLHHDEPRPYLDPYFLPVYPAGHRLRFVYELNRLDWLEQFGRGRDKREKGIFELTY